MVQTKEQHSAPPVQEDPGVLHGGGLPGTQMPSMAKQYVPGRQSCEVLHHSAATHVPLEQKKEQH
jgi:hypothetical protein